MTRPGSVPPRIAIKQAVSAPTLRKLRIIPAGTEMVCQASRPCKTTDSSRAGLYGGVAFDARRSGSVLLSDERVRSGGSHGN